MSAFDLAEDLKNEPNHKGNFSYCRYENVRKNEGGKCLTHKRKSQ